jgi:AraC family transcriptional regulator of adaptative response / DNA-3-methyladenine glycosylase II
VEPAPRDYGLELRVRGAAPASLFQISTNARRVFDLAADPAPIARSLRGDSLLAPLIRRRPGLRIPGAWDPFECGIQAIVAQGVGAATTRARISQLIARFGQVLPDASAGLTHLFPTPAVLAAGSLNGLGLPPSKAAALRAFARAVHRKAIDFTAPAEEVIRAVAAIPGVRESTAQLISMRALAEPDAFPSTEHAARADSWRPWRSYAVMHLWCA